MGKKSKKAAKSGAGKEVTPSAGKARREKIAALRDIEGRIDALIERSSIGPLQREGATPAVSSLFAETFRRCTCPFAVFAMGVDMDEIKEAYEESRSVEWSEEREAIRKSLDEQI